MVCCAPFGGANNSGVSFCSIPPLVLARAQWVLTTSISHPTSNTEHPITTVVSVSSTWAQHVSANRLSAELMHSVNLQVR